MDRKPAEVCHPGEHLLDELEARNWAIPALSHLTGITESVITDIINGKTDVTPEIANAFSREIGTSAEFWMNLQRAWDERSK